MYYDSKRELIGIDLSPKMIAVSRNRLENTAQLIIGEMSNLKSQDSENAAALVNFFAIHHLDNEVLVKALNEWNRVLQSQGQLVIAAWEGTGAIDYGDESDVIALKHCETDLKEMIQNAGFIIDRCKSEFIKDHILFELENK
jgi:SAM-dependent methyltransferase